MNPHLSLRSGNPALRASTFKNISRADAKGMTIQGTVNKTALSLLLLMASASYTWSNPSPSLMLLGMFGGFILAIITVFKKTWAPYTVSGYALLKGLALGGISQYFEMKYPGIVSQAIFLTFGILATLLLAYKSGIIKPTENFKLGVFAATGGIAMLYFISWIMSWFGGSIGFIHNNSTFGILFSLGFLYLESVYHFIHLPNDIYFMDYLPVHLSPVYFILYPLVAFTITLCFSYLPAMKASSITPSEALRYE